MFIKKYRAYKKALQVLVFFNIFLIALGLVATVRFLKENSLHSGEVAFVGLMIFLVGIVLPIYLLKKLEEKYREWEAQTLKLFSSWISSWIEIQESRNPDSPILKDFGFWLNIVVIGLNAAKGEIKNPYFRFFTEFANLLREAHRSVESEHRAKRRKAAKS